MKRNIINASTTDFFIQLYNRQLPTFNNIAFKTQITLDNKLKNLKITQLPKLIIDKENWVVNISNKQIPDNVLDILSLGGKFNYNHTKKTLPINKVITNIEYNIHNIPNLEINKIRSDVSYWLQNIAFYLNNYNIGSLNLTTNILQTKNFLKNNNDIMILNADKNTKSFIS